MTIPNSAFFVMPRDGSQWRNAVGLWVTAAGWAAAAEHRFGSGLVITPAEVVDSRGALAFTEPSPPRSTSRSVAVPLVVRTGMKDARQAIRATRFRRAGAPVEVRDLTPAFVWQHHDLFARAGSAMSRSFAVPLVSYVHAPQVWESASWGVRRPGWSHLLEHFGERPALAESDVVACVSAEVAREVVRFGVEQSRIVVSPMAVDAQRFRPDTAAAVAVRHELDLGDGPVVGWAGSFRGFHGVDDLVQAFERITTTRADTRLLLVGSGAARETIEAQVRRLGLEQQVVFAGAVPHVAMPRYLGAMDIAVTSARPETGFHYSPQKLREYLACGRATIAPAIGEVPEVVTNGVHALLYEPGDVESLERAILELLEAPDERERLGRQGREHVEATATWDVRLRELLDSSAFTAARRARSR